MEFPVCFGIHKWFVDWYPVRIWLVCKPRRKSFKSDVFIFSDTLSDVIPVSLMKLPVDSWMEKKGWELTMSSLFDVHDSDREQ